MIEGMNQARLSASDRSVAIHPERVADVSPGQARRRGGRRPGSGPPRERHPERVEEYTAKH